MVAIIETPGTEDKELNTCAPGSASACGSPECTEIYCGCGKGTNYDIALKEPEPSFERQVLERFRNRCANCGGTERLAVGMIVPEDHGGRKVVENGTVLCRTCEFAAATGAADEEARKMVTFWVSRDLYDSVLGSGFPSTSALIRYMIAQYVEDPARFDDMKEPDVGENDVKVNVRVDSIAYKQFKKLVDAKGLLVSGALKALIHLFVTNTRG